MIFTKVIDLKALIEVELKVPSALQQLYLNGNLLSNNNLSLKSSGIRNDDIILVRSSPSQPSPSQEAERARLSILSNPQARAQIAIQVPGIEATLNDPSAFERFYNEMKRQQAQQVQQQHEITSSDPFDLESQKKIEEQIRKEKILQSRWVLLLTL